MEENRSGRVLGGSFKEFGIYSMQNENIIRVIYRRVIWPNLIFLKENSGCVVFCFVFLKTECRKPKVEMRNSI